MGGDFPLTKKLSHTVRSTEDSISEGITRIQSEERLAHDFGQESWLSLGASRVRRLPRGQRQLHLAIGQQCIGMR